MTSKNPIADAIGSFLRKQDTEVRLFEDTIVIAFPLVVLSL
jgi:hypothetical protein